MDVKEYQQFTLVCYFFYLKFFTASLACYFNYFLLKLRPVFQDLS